MAPIATSLPNEFAVESKPTSASFSDGLRTSGQHPPVYELLQPYDAFPRTITTQNTLWTGDGLQVNTEKWCYPFDPSEILELGQAADRYIEAQLPLVNITKVGYRYRLAMSR